MNDNEDDFCKTFWDNLAPMEDVKVNEDRNIFKHTVDCPVDSFGGKSKRNRSQLLQGNLNVTWRRIASF